MCIACASAVCDVPTYRASSKFEVSVRRAKFDINTLRLSCAYVNTVKDDGNIKDSFSWR